MLNYVIRRLLYAIPIVLGVNLITFLLFFGVSSPQQMAVQILGDKHVTQEDINTWLSERGYDLPRLWNAQADGLGKISQTIFFKKSISLMWFDFGASDRDQRSIGDDIRQRMGPSLTVAIPIFIMGILTNIVIAMLVAFHRGTYLDLLVLLACVILMSISELFYIIGSQYVFGIQWRMFPISGFDTGPNALRFVAMPVLIGVIGGIGGGVRYYRTIFLEEINRDYVRTARSKGLGENSVLFKHALKNAMIPILTGVVMTLPFLFLGSLLLENFFTIPGLGSYTIDAINAKDFAIVRTMVFLGAVLYVIGILLTDISYTFVDPRVQLE